MILVIFDFFHYSQATIVNGSEICWHRAKNKKMPTHYSVKVECGQL